LLCGLPNSPEKTVVTEQFDTCIKKGRGLGKASLALIEAMVPIIEAAKPINGRGVGYKLFVAGLIPSIAAMPQVYTLLRKARERGIIPWSSIVDETRELERVASWGSPMAYANATIRDYRPDYWDQQQVRVEVWSEKGTIRGVLKPVLDEYGVGFRVMHGFASATSVHEIADDDDGRPLIAIYVGDWDPSGLFMSERDLPKRLSRYDGNHVALIRVALTGKQLARLPSFPAADKKKDKRYPWFVENFGDRCWELDALYPGVLRACVEEEILSWIEPTACNRCKVTEAAQQESLIEVMTAWARRQS
jgi:hypothetical protein